MKLYVFLAAGVAAVLAAAPAWSKDEPCTDGVDCYCDRVNDSSDALYDPGVSFCEDYEHSSLDQNGGTGWADKFGGIVSGCWTPEAQSGVHWSKTVEGTCPSCCVNVVGENSCEVPGQVDCTFQGSKSMGHRFRPGESGGVVGAQSFAAGQHIGATMAVKYSYNYDNANTPKKSNQFGGKGHCIFGCSSGTYVSKVSGNPFHGLLFWHDELGAPSWTDVVGRGGYSGVALGWYPSSGSYDFDRDHGVDRWHCWRWHIKNVGQQNAEIRHWIDDRLLVHLKNVDLRNMYDNDGIDYFTLNNYFNGGYTGSNVAYRYEDNLHITRSSEPATCDEIGFNVGDGQSGGSVPPPPSDPPPSGGGGGEDPLGPPGQPVLVP